MSEYRERRYLSQEGLSLYYRVYGNAAAAGTAVLCLPGLTRNSKDFNRLAKRLMVGRYVVCPDYRGRGQSELARDPSDYHPSVHLNDIRHLLVVEGLHRIVVIGTSFGGFLAMGMALVMPAALQAVLLNDVGPEVSDEGVARIMDYVGHDNPQADWVSAAAELRRMFPTLSFKTDEEWLAAAHATWREGNDGLLHFDWDTRLATTIARARREVRPWSLFRGITRVPTLVIRGELSDVLCAETLDRMAQEHRQLSHTIVRGCGHPPSLSEPEALEAIDEFFSSY